MNYRRRLMVAFGVCGLWTPIGSPCQPAGKPVRVGILVRTSAAKYQVRESRFITTMRELGWIEGQNITYDRVFADDDLARLPALAAALVRRGPNLIYASEAAPAEALIAATRTIPIVLGSGGDMVERGWVQSLAHPGGNVTGVTNIGSDLGPKRLQLLKRLLPKVARVGVLLNPIIGGGARELKAIEQAAAGLRVTVIPIAATKSSELEAGFVTLAKGRIDAVLITHSDLFLSERKRILDFSAKWRIPVIAHRSEMTDAGALMSYSSSLDEQIGRAAHLADKILRGAKPGDIAVELPTIFELVVNRKTAKALGITIPDEILLQATRVID